MDEELVRGENGIFELSIPVFEISVLGKSPEDWLKECEVHLYGIQKVGVYDSDLLEEKNYQMTIDADQMHRDRYQKQISHSFKAAALVDNPLHNDVIDYLDTVIGQVPRNNQDYLLAQKFKVLPTAGLIELAKRIPMYRAADDQALHLLSKRSSELPDEILIDGLKRDDRFVGLCIKNKLGAQVAPLLIKRIKERKPLMQNAAGQIVSLVTKHATLTPELKADLHWHFVHAGYQQHSIASTLSELPDFDFHSSIQEAWMLSFGGKGRRAQIAPYALCLGDKEALRLTLLWFRGQHPEWLKKKHTVRLQKVLESQLSRADMLAWAEKNFTRLAFDPETQTYRLP